MNFETRWKKFGIYFIGFFKGDFFCKVYIGYFCI